MPIFLFRFHLVQGILLHKLCKQYNLEWTSPDLTADIEAKATDSTDVVEEVLEEEDDSPGFGVLASLLAFTFVVYGRRKD
jgi:hypothetical protein